MTQKLHTKTETWPVTKLTEHPRNARKHHSQQLQQVMNSLRRFGFAMPVIVDPEGVILAGHARVQAAVKLGWAEAPVIVVSGWTEAQKRAYLIADNQLTLAGDWDTEKLGDELKALQENLFDMGLTGFAPAQVHRLTTPKAPKIATEDGVTNSLGLKSGTFLEWSGNLVSMTSAEEAAFSAAFTRYVKRKGKGEGFLRAVLDGEL